MVASWAEEEFATINLKDKRRDKRAKKVLSDLGERPTASISAASGGHKETMAAYRFFDNENVTFETIIQPHIDQTLKRIQANPVVLYIQDTSELDLTRPSSVVAGVGSLNGKSRRGVALHLMQAFTPRGIPLGAVSATVKSRPPDKPGMTKAKKRKARRAARIEEKESFRWVQGLRTVREISELSPDTTSVCISDSEADIYEMFTEPRESDNGGRLEWIIRACQDRVVDAGTTDSPVTRLREAVLATPIIHTKTIKVRGRKPLIAIDQRARRQPQTDRVATVTIRAAAVAIHAPLRAKTASKPVPVNVVLVREENPPDGETPVEWILITTLPIGDRKAVETIIEYYEQRWSIEVFFKTLKSGCRVEKRRFESLDRLLPCLGIYLIVAWRTMMLQRLGQNCPDMSCETVLQPEEWQSVYAKVTGDTPPETAPSLNEIIRMIAQLGGYVNVPGRKDMPGVQTLWIGMQRMRDLAWAWEYVHEKT
jgi:hypothetical protein